MTVTKRKVSVSLDEDLVAELENGDDTLSAEINEAIRARVEVLRQRRLLNEMLAAYEAEDGPPDEDLVRRFEQLLRGA